MSIYFIAGEIPMCVRQQNTKKYMYNLNGMCLISELINLNDVDYSYLTNIILFTSIKYNILFTLTNISHWANQTTMTNSVSFGQVTDIHA